MKIYNSLQHNLSEYNKSLLHITFITIDEFSPQKNSILNNKTFTNN